jgi:hypothetical protein
MFLAVSRNTGNPTPHVKAEGARIAELPEAGLIELVLLKAGRPGAVPLPRTADLATARKGLGSPPLVANGITSFELTGVVTLDGTW